MRRPLLLCLLVGLLLPARAVADTQTFVPVGREQTFTVPAGVTSVHVIAVGAPGGDRPGIQGGVGGRAEADVVVRPGQALFVEVGGAGSFAVAAPGGFNGGGSAQFGAAVASGGGASDVRLLAMGNAATLDSRVVVAGGGGGAGRLLGVGAPRRDATGGAGGGLSGVGGAGASGISCDIGGGSPGTQTTGAAPGVGGPNAGSGAGAGGGGWFGGFGDSDGCYGGGGGSGHFGDSAANGVFGVAAPGQSASVTIAYLDLPSSGGTSSAQSLTGATSRSGAAPQTRITTAVKRVVRTSRRRASVAFRFAASDPRATFRCRLDAGKQAACESGKRYRVKPGPHRFTVVAVLDGVRDPSPAHVSFTVRRTRR